MKAQKLPFRPRSRLLVLLGDQLIRDSGIAVFELVKNAYDADASNVTLSMSDIGDTDKAQIVVEDNGSGMDWKTLTEVWLEPGTDHRIQQRLDNRRSKRYKRLPLGEKGVGRFAVHKLGQKVTVITRAKNQNEILVEIDWQEFEKERYLDDVQISIIERKPEIFTGSKTGTRLQISKLRNDWTRGMVRKLYRSVTSISSPFNAPDDFTTTILLSPDPGEVGNPRNPGWLEGLFNTADALSFALFHAQCNVSSEGLLSYTYDFKPLNGMSRVEPRKVKVSKLEHDELRAIKNYGIGEVVIDLYIFDLEAQILSFASVDKKGFREFLSQNGGIRVYRDGIRVYDYGEPENDWLGFGIRRVNNPVKTISNNQVLGTVSLKLDKSQDLIEKTNREGFVENEAYRAFQSSVLFSLSQIESERNKDKQRIRNAYSSKSQKQPVLDDISTLRDKLEKRNLGKELSPYVDRIEKQFIEVRDQLLTAASAGLSFSVVIHEVEKGIKELELAVDKNVDISRLRAIAKHLSELIEGLAYLFRQSGQRVEKASSIIRQSLFNVEFRLKAHNIEVINGLGLGNPDISVKCAKRLIISTIMNLVDNSIFWLQNKGKKDKKIYIGTSNSLVGGPAIVFADNGPGFIDPPEYLTQPFFTRKPDGMGLGLHLASEIMKVHKGRLEFPEPKDVELSKGIQSAVVALVFGESK